MEGRITGSSTDDAMIITNELPMADPATLASLHGP
jgi:hypothetical protein